ncbi:unnamed protein product [Lymnaea stagnalis]|uniref:Replication termination factor 2 n=1 Tax=Lymnaea stagnalis TaxID=6523 RepID=A0AAV2HUC1_LYMST
MGCDGGTIPKRDELVKTKRKGEQKDKISELAFKWKHCAISQEVLIKPIVACELGRLYNKESVLEFLLDRSKFEIASQLEHLRGLKDVKELNLTDNPESRSKDADKGGQFDPNISDFICPVVGLVMSGTFKFCFLWSCGCVVSERALREVKSETCHKVQINVFCCGKAFKGDDDVIVLNGTEDDIILMKTNMEKRRTLAKFSKKSKRAEKHKLAEPIEEGIFINNLIKMSCPPTSSSDSNLEPPTLDTELDKSTTKIPMASGSQETSSSKSGIGRLIPQGKFSVDKTSKLKKTSTNTGSSIQKDPKTSQTFKSLFTTSEQAKNQKHAHWVTYNPLYY